MFARALAASLLAAVVAIAPVSASALQTATSAAGSVVAAAESGAKVVIVVGPTHDVTSSYRTYADAIYAEAIKYTANVVKVYSPNATWANVKAAVQGANVIVYLGHGNGWPSPYTFDPNYTTKDGMGLNYDTNGDGTQSDYELKYYGEPYFANEVRFAANAIVILNHLCYASGNSEPGDPAPTLDVAKQRVDNFGAGFIKAGARAVLAEGHGTVTGVIRDLFTTHQTVDALWRSQYDYHGNAFSFASVRSQGFTASMDPDTASGGYYRSLVAYPDVTTDAVVATASAPAVASAPQVTSFTGPASGYSNALAPAFSLNFSDAVTGLAAEDFTIGGTATGCTAAAPTGTGASWTVAVTGCSAGTVSLTLAAGSVAGASGSTGPSAASAGPTIVIDRTAPAATRPVSSLRRGTVSAGGSLPISLTWSGSDTGGAGIAGYDVARSIDGGAFSIVATGLDTNALTAWVSSTRSYRFEVRAVDRAGNRSAWVVGASFRASLVQDNSSAVYRSPGWTSLASAAYSGGTARRASLARTNARYTFTGSGIGVVASVGSNRGAFRVYIDGVFAATVDTYAPTAANRVIVWSKRWASSSTHSIRIVVVGTAGRPTVVFDAFERYR